MPNCLFRHIRHTACLLVASAVSFAAVPAAVAANVGRTYTVTAPDGVTLAVEEAGDPDGPAVIFIHGLLGSTLDWDVQLKSAELGRYRLIAYDMRGHGLSGKPAGTDVYADGRRWADDLAAVIDAAHARNPVLVGWSLGGAVISNYLAAYGDDRIAGAVYVDGVIELKPEQITAHPQLYRDLISPDLRAHLDAERVFLGLCFATQPPTPAFERLLANAAMASWDMQRAVQSMTVFAERGLKRIDKPVLLIYGGRDALVQAKPAIARATVLNPRVRSKLYAESGHAPFIEEADRFDRDLATFVDTAVRH
ncbi:alpha/beta hydrolase [Trinickia caryophylli]|uniref:Pimeloyl-ACP methyl ester carboxylesterase n=1 Tax=Trinickia caryophylli TaxID=28094 RepID=A0A1X7DM64_TRICW|nr:alpha/beta hydrolase [Trinickia caryophylli]PMS10666.1 alpha/beta hydrolase [Trinickia caryophylli]TRX17148.1 alpha/beta hydrolase [Trinickia caryophylli]WQE12118.1 alpha/beta hydrolase [Trinickia caryophylli]SMF17918.1 Pimeloyl-ACP methyl ester carboxylesterase [Trinickia caryophylli]GLU31753.1 alpha/beta hydrolase [Trinickia caryophylli]